MAENNSQQQHRSPSQIAAAARGGHDGPHHGRSPSEIARSVHGHGQSSEAGHTLLSDQKENQKEKEWGERADGKGWAEWLQEQRGKAQQNDDGGGGPPPEKGRTLPEEEKQREKDQERDKGRSLSERAAEWVKEEINELTLDRDCGY